MRLLNAAPEEIPEILLEMRKESKAITEELGHIVWHMKGIGWDEAWNLTYGERKILAGVIKDNVEKFSKMMTLF